MPATGSVRRATGQNRYEFVAPDGEVLAVADYEPGPGRVVMHHTYTAPAHRGEGIAALLVAGALDDLRARELQVVPSCWFVAQFFDEHAEYRDLLAD